MLPLSTKLGAPSRAEAGLLDLVVSVLVYLPLASLFSTAMVGAAAAVSAFGYSGAQAHTRYWWANLYMAVPLVSKRPMVRPPASDQAANMSLAPPLICIWFSKKRWYRSRVTVAVVSTAFEAAWKAVSIENGALARPAFCACVTTGVTPPAVTPPQVWGRVASTLPLRSFCGT